MHGGAPSSHGLPIRAPNSQGDDSRYKGGLERRYSFRLDDNYMHGAGDTYFSGKMLGKLARILIIAEEIGIDADDTSGGVTEKDFNEALDRLRAGTTIWLNGKAESPLLYDASWGGIVMCGCDYNDETGKCNNRFLTAQPSLTPDPTSALASIMTTTSTSDITFLQLQW